MLTLTGQSLPFRGECYLVCSTLRTRVSIVMSMKIQIKDGWKSCSTIVELDMIALRGPTSKPGSEALREPVKISKTRGITS